MPGQRSIWRLYVTLTGHLGFVSERKSIVWLQGLSGGWCKRVNWFFWTFLNINSGRFGTLIILQKWGVRTSEWRGKWKPKHLLGAAGKTQAGNEIPANMPGFFFCPVHHTPAVHSEWWSGQIEVSVFGSDREHHTWPKASSLFLSLWQQTSPRHLEPREQQLLLLKLVNIYCSELWADAHTSSEPLTASSFLWAWSCSDWTWAGATGDRCWKPSVGRHAVGQRFTHCSSARIHYKYKAGTAALATRGDGVISQLYLTST